MVFKLWGNGDYGFGRVEEHAYSLVVMGGGYHNNEVYTDRHRAEGRLYELAGQYGLKLKEVYDDKHDKTYIYDKGVEAHINRVR